MLKTVFLWYVVLSLLSTLPFIWAMYSHDRELLRKIRESGVTDSRAGRFYLIRQHRSEPLPKGLWFLLTLMPVLNLFWVWVLLTLIRDFFIGVRDGFGFGNSSRRDK